MQCVCMCAYVCELVRAFKQRACAVRRSLRFVVLSHTLKCVCACVHVCMNMVFHVGACTGTCVSISMDVCPRKCKALRTCRSYYCTVLCVFDIMFSHMTFAEDVMDHVVCTRYCVFVEDILAEDFVYDFMCA